MTWHDVLATVDTAIEDLKLLMNTDPRHGVFYQQRLAVMLRRKMDIVWHIADEEQAIDTNTSQAGSTQTGKGSA